MQKLVITLRQLVLENESTRKLVAKSASFLAAKKDKKKSSFNELKLFCLDIFDTLFGFWKVSPSWPLSQ